MRRRLIGRTMKTVKAQSKSLRRQQSYQCSILRLTSFTLSMKHEEHLNIVEFSISSDNGQPTFKSGDISMVSKFIIAPSSISSETPVSGEDPPNTPQQSPEPELNRNIDQSTLASGSLPTVHTQTPSEEYPSTTFHEHDPEYDTPDQAARSRDHTFSPAPSPRKSLPVSKFSELAGWNIQKR